MATPKGCDTGRKYFTDAAQILAPLSLGSLRKKEGRLVRTRRAAAACDLEYKVIDRADTIWQSRFSIPYNSAELQ